ncbi:MAG: DUF1559 domain-containing protein [Pirellulaceae bacterium]|nr:DUF1559 domain-containing protein [Pirellulaceae bacterium]
MFRHFTIPLIILCVLGFTGCSGPSTEDLIMRAAQRKRPRDGDLEEEKKPTADNLAAETQSGKSTSADAAETSKLAGINATADDGSPAVTDAASGETAPLAGITIKPIDERKPDQPLSETERRQRAFDHLKGIGKALEKSTNNYKYYPRRFASNSAGIPTLSWRVELLPHLGYEALYKRFDLSKPWNMEPNKSLLQYIPDEYVSPERFDTNTNFLLPAAQALLFGDNKPMRAEKVEDGIENTIMLLEIDDEYCVPWTKPADYEPKNIRLMRADLGQLRGDGTFALWANGWPVLLGSGLTNEQLFKAMTFEAGDTQRAGDIHRDITVGAVSDAATIVVSTTPTGPPTESPSELSKPELVNAIPRERPPTESEIATASKMLREIYAKRMTDAKKNSEKRSLASEMISDAAQMPSDLAGAFTLQSAAMKLASDSGGVEQLCEAIDQRVGRFDVDAYDQNMAALLNFAKMSFDKDPDEIEGEEYLARSLRVIRAAISVNDFVGAAALARHSFGFIDRDNYDELPKDLNRLRVLLASAQREFDKASEHLQAYRDDPNDVDAAATFGRFLCFIKGDWEVGLPLLAMGGNKTLMQMAQLDLQGASSFRDEMVIGDAWWELSQQTRNGLYRQASQERAAFWYRQAVSQVPPSLDKIHVESRLSQLKNSQPTSPIALVEHLAKEVGVDLSQSLSDIANGQRKIARRNDDGDD